MKFHIENNKGIIMFDSVRFITSNLSNKFSIKMIKGLDDYRVVLTHGVVGELMLLLENDYFGLDKNKIIVLTNNIQANKILLEDGIKCFPISEYIFTDDDTYTVLQEKKLYDCIFPGRDSKVIDLFQIKYKSNVNLLYKTKNYPYPREAMPKLFNQAKTGVMTTEAEGSCLSVGEMLSLIHI